jgi:hypothetical protein
MYPQKIESNSRYFTTQEFEEPLTATPQLMKLSIVVPRATIRRIGDRSSKLDRPHKNVERTQK